MDTIIRDQLKELVIKNSNLIFGGSGEYTVGQSAETREAKEITDDTDLITDLSYNSVSAVRLVVDIEQEFEIEFPDELLVFEKLRKFSYLCDTVFKCVKNLEDNDQSYTYRFF
ncbi:MAG: phosphopantetheine-binding protein [Clostridiales bacterium]|jgi:acyl carrier protein|nr:phosphopantetheine-binding protein [Clostridiales bacterium]